MSEFSRRMRAAFKNITDPQSYADRMRVSPLISAVKSNDHDRIKELVSRGYKINDYGMMGKTPFHEAIKSSEPSTVRLLIELGADPLLPVKGDMVYRDPIHIAVKHGRDDMIPVFSALGLPLDQPAENGWRPLDHAVKLGKMDVVSALIEAGADPVATGQSGGSIASLAVFCSNPAMVEMLLKTPKAHAVFSEEFYKASQENPPLIRAIKDGTRSIVRTMLSAGVSPNQKAQNGHNALNTAIYFGQADILCDLLEEGADVMPLKAEELPIIMLAKYAHKFDNEGLDKAFAAMVDYGADLFARSDEPYDAATIFVLNGMMSEAMAMTLMSRPEAKAACDPMQSPILAEAVKGDLGHVVKAALKHGVAKPDMLIDDPSGTLFNLAVTTGDVDLVKSMLSYDPDLARTNHAGQTAIEIAKHLPKVDVLELLSSHKLALKDKPSKKIHDKPKATPPSP